MKTTQPRVFLRTSILTLAALAVWPVVFAQAPKAQPVPAAPPAAFPPAPVPPGKPQPGSVDPTTPPVSAERKPEVPRAKPVPANDPFVRDGQPGAGAAVGMEEEQPYSMLYGLVEYIEVPRERWLTYTGANPVVSDATQLRAEVQRWIGAGEAKAVELTCVGTMSGNRTVIESTVEWRFPNKFGPAAPVPVPIGIESRNSHLTFEWEPVLGPDGSTVDSQMAPRLVYFCGSDFPNPAERERAQPGDIGKPRFVVDASSLGMSSASNQARLMSVATPPDEHGKAREEVRILTFFRTARVGLKPAVMTESNLLLEYTLDQKPAMISKRNYEALLKSPDPAAKTRVAAIQAALKDGAAFFPHALMLEVERVEVTLADLNAWFAGKDLDVATDELRAAAATWARAGRGRVADRKTGPVRSGQRHVWDSVTDVPRANSYTYEGAVPEDPKVPNLNTMQVRTLDDFIKVAALRTPRGVTPLTKNPLVFPTEIETPNVGYNIEVEATLAPGGAANMNIALTDSRVCRTVVLHRREVNGQLVPDVEQPIVATMKVQTNIIVALGVPKLISIGTPATDSGQPEAQKRVLTFVTIRN